ncbi:MAG: DUF86 domain-containing protein [Flavobacteriales bacterium]
MTYLGDIAISIDLIQEYTIGIADFGALYQDFKTYQAVERNFEIIGEAVNRLLLIAPELEISNALKIVGLRNRIAHEYHKLDAGVIWSVVKDDLSGLEEEVEALILFYSE